MRRLSQSTRAPEYGQNGPCYHCCPVPEFRVCRLLASSEMVSHGSLEPRLQVRILARQPKSFIPTSFSHSELPRGLERLLSPSAGIACRGEAAAPNVRAETRHVWFRIRIVMGEERGGMPARMTTCWE